LEEEYSPFSRDMEGSGLLATCKELDIPIAAYSPLSRGILTGALTKPTDIDKGDMRHKYDRFQPEHWEHNYALVTKFKSIAERKGVTPAQLSLAWILKQRPDGFVPIPGSSRPQVILENLKALEVTITDEEDKEIREATAGVAGGRYNKHVEHTLSV
ncbi:Aldo/keto reductase, partial [Atractiella rhizophila]